ncbi:MAG TPA: tetratricopeptide repeat protein [Steroidobacteraceae bacterium]
MSEFAVLILDTPDCEEIQALLQTDPPAAIARLRAHAHQGERQSQLALGQLLINGVGAPRDATQALGWFRKAATSRVPMAMNMVGRCHEYGLGTCVDYEQAARWYYRAALFECDWAIYNYAHMLANGRGVKKDRAAAFNWFNLAASRGHARAMHFLGLYHENGWETPASQDIAFDWYRRSAEGGDYRGQCSYASVLAEHGRMEEALRWLRLAATTATPAYLSALAATLRQSPHQGLGAFADSLPARVDYPTSPGP